ncbi:hypothetical protein V6Z11_D10G082600 [Gossypium hirsutum]
MGSRPDWLMKTISLNGVLQLSDHLILFITKACSLCSLLHVLPSCCLLSSSNLDIELSY